MSHFTSINTQIRDIAALQSACQELGLSLLPKAQARGYLQNRIQGDYVIQLKGPYDVALNPQPDGSYGLTADLWQGHVEAELGPHFGRLLQVYGVHKTIQEARKRGHHVSRSLQHDGAIRLIISGV